MSAKNMRFGALLLCALFAVGFAEPAPFEACPNTDVSARDVQVDVSQCNNTEACPLYRGSSHDFIISFVPTQNSTARIERSIIAIFGPARSGRLGVEVPYGSATPSGSTTTRDFDHQTVNEVGLIEGQTYTHRDVFPVMPSAPATGLRVRYIIRETVTGLSRRQAKWNRHPGAKFACVEIPVQLV